VIQFRPILFLSLICVLPSPHAGLGQFDYRQLTDDFPCLHFLKIISGQDPAIPDGGGFIGKSHLIQVKHIASGGQGSVSIVFNYANLNMSVYKIQHLDNLNEFGLHLETKVLLSVDHFNLPKILSYGKTEQFYFMETPMFPSTTLDHTLSSMINGKLKPKAIQMLPKLLSVIREVLSAAVGLHAKKWIHADIKPANILIEDTVTADIKLIDLGSARSLHQRVNSTYGFTRFYLPNEYRKLDFDGFEFPLTAQPTLDFFAIGRILKEIDQATPSWWKNPTGVNIFEYRKWKKSFSQFYRSLTFWDHEKRLNDPKEIAETLGFHFDWISKIIDEEG
jgi:serine/threonine protein kinase